MGIRSSEDVKTDINFSDIYAVEFANYGLVHSPKLGLGHAKECFRKRLLNTQEVLFCKSCVPFVVFLLLEISV